MNIARFMPGKLLPRWRRVRAERAARSLDDLVDARVGLMPELPEDLRERYAEHLAELVLLASAYRRFAAGHLSRRELHRCGLAMLGRTADNKRVLMVQLADGE